ncbi:MULTISPECIES: single-stranded DNA-binding protein [unclassified Microbacterium]|uniref:single-stranded DNA-binding protein n=1 Tax=unclassified Microbacterium TaxID=2609290 RepID=UPI00097F495E|nr:single-stranded DNA-binding protein [Microbacterium sp. JB110]RCS62818.1 single-stranded DNA-binding protein [Microbacterium sp. JB110]SJM62387.1 Single-stranded DNA-binding protein [Frigoribacterium sp. JB110]
MSDSITVIGTVGSDPEARVTPTGKHVTSFRLACTPRVRDTGTGEWRDGETNWYSISAWEHLGRNVLESIRKGERAIVTGRLRLRTWEKDERRGMDAEIVAGGVGHDLKWGTSSYTKASRQATDDAPDDRSGESEGAAAQATPETASSDSQAQWDAEPVSVDTPY